MSCASRLGKKNVKWLAGDFVGVVAEDRFRRLVEDQDCSVCIRRDDGLGGQRENFAKSRFQGAQFLLRFLELVQIGRCRANRHDFTIGVADRKFRDQPMESSTGGQNLHSFPGDRLTGFDDFFFLFDEGGAMGG